LLGTRPPVALPSRVSVGLIRKSEGFIEGAMVRALFIAPSKSTTPSLRCLRAVSKIDRNSAIDVLKCEKLRLCKGIILCPAYPSIRNCSSCSRELLSGRGTNTIDLADPPSRLRTLGPHWPRGLSRFHVTGSMMKNALQLVA